MTGTNFARWERSIITMNHQMMPLHVTQKPSLKTSSLKGGNQFLRIQFVQLMDPTANSTPKQTAMTRNVEFSS